MPSSRLLNRLPLRQTVFRSSIFPGQRPLSQQLKMASGLARKYEINADMGEGFGRWKMGPDEELMPYIDAANIACGYHAGDPSIMLKTVRLCKKHGVKAGAHPGLQDMFGFGRRKIEIDPKDMYAMVLYQVGALKAILNSEGVELSHIKPHGELFFYMQRDETIMRAVLEACATFGDNIPVYASQNATQEAMCKELGIPFQGEVYVDIDYSSEGKLIPVAQSKVATPELCYERALSASLKDEGKDNSGGIFSFGFAGKPFSICVHSDHPTVLQNVTGVRKAVEEANKQRFPNASD